MALELGVKALVAQSCLTLSDPMDCSLPGSSVHGIFQARVLEWGAILYYYHLTHHIFSPAPLTPKPFHLVVLCLPLPPYCLFPSQKPEWLLKMWVRSHHSSAQALQEVYILLRKKNIHIPFHELWALPFGPLSLAFLTSSPLSALLSAPATPVLLLFFKLAWDILPSDIYMAPFLSSFMSLLTFYLLKALRSIAVGK